LISLRPLSECCPIDIASWRDMLRTKEGAPTRMG
jgi:hypothetical protein